MAEAVTVTNREHIEARVLSGRVALMCRLTTSPLPASVVIGAMMVWLIMEDHGLWPSLIWYAAVLLVFLLRWGSPRLDMAMLTKQAAEQARSTRLNEAVTPTIEIGELPPARRDEGLIRQVWGNLLDNAVKYTSKVASPHIVVSGRDEGERLVDEIRDNGVGFDSAFSANLFGVFRRLHGARDYPGSGVGLAIVQRIVTRHGGEVWARAEPDQGAAFSFSLPNPVPRAVG